MVQYALHMPYDCDMNSETFFAADNDAWKEILRIMYEYCTEIIEEKGRRTKPHDAKLTDKFLLLAAKCTKQVRIVTSDMPISPIKTTKYFVFLSFAS